MLKGTKGYGLIYGAYVWNGQNISKQDGPIHGIG